MRKPWKKLLALTLCASLLLPAGLFGVGSSAAATAEESEHDFTIDSPYKNVNWGTWKALKAALHTHTIASDGASNLDEMVESHYSLGFDILAITDHMVNNRGWNTSRKRCRL